MTPSPFASHAIQGAGVPQDLTLAAETHFAQAQLGDRRRSKRLVRVAQQILTNPQGSLPQKIPDVHQLDAAYRLCNCPDVTPEAIQLPHRDHLQTLLAARSDELILIAHDSTTVNFTTLSTEELGVLGGGRKSKPQKGFLLHNSLAISTRREILGLLHQRIVTPQKDRHNDNKAIHRASAKTLSKLWKDCFQAVHERRPATGSSRWIHLADRGADITEFLDGLTEHDAEYIVRSRTNRKVRGMPKATLQSAPSDPASASVSESSDIDMTLRHAWDRQPVLGRRTLRVPARAGVAERTATLEIRFASVQIVPPVQARGRERGILIPTTVVEVREVDAPTEIPPIEWRLLTNLSVTNVADAWQVVDWYGVRWTVEEYHKGLKEGLGIENLQFTTRRGLENAIALLCVVAVLLQQIREWSRNPEVAQGPIAGKIPAVWIEVLSRWRYPRGDRRLETVWDWVQALARLGGHQNQRSLGPPGWKTLLRGWNQFQTLLEGYRIAKCGGS